MCEIVLKVLGDGADKFFRDPWNRLDFILVVLGLVLQQMPPELIPHNSDKLAKMTRIFRITSLVKFINKNKKIKSYLYVRSTRLMSQIALITPIAMKFVPLYMLSFYMLGVTGMQIFRPSAMVTDEISPYSTYDKYSNFNTFLASQFLLIQLLI
jgi:hypothetical protein